VQSFDLVRAHGPGAGSSKNRRRARAQARPAGAPSYVEVHRAAWASNFMGAAFGQGPYPSRPGTAAREPLTSPHAELGASMDSRGTAVSAVRLGEGFLWNLARSRLRGEGAIAYLAVHRDWIRMGMPAAGRSVTRCFSSGTKLGRKLRRTLRRSVARITTASDSAKLIPMQIRGPAPKGRYA
jgi:hypothetical protein